MPFEISEEDYLEHYGTKRHSGRYPWGSGGDDEGGEQRSRSFLGAIADLKKSGMTDTEASRALGYESTTQFRAAKTMALNEAKRHDIATAEKLSAKGMGASAIAKQMFGSASKESTVRSLLAPGAKDKADILTATSEVLKKRIGEDNFVDISRGVSNHLGIAPTKLNTAVAMLELQGYERHEIYQPQVGRSQDTRTVVICPPGTKWADVMQNQHKIVDVKDFSEDGGRTFDEIKFPMGVDSKRIQVVYGDEGGSKSDGVMYIRPGAKDLDMGGARYVQARILVDGTHYLKGMAVQKDGLPDGVDIQFHTNKAKTGNKLDAMKLAEGLNKDKETGKITGTIDPDNPFGSSIRHQILDAKGKPKSAINIVNDEEHWDDWSRNLASQMLSKQKTEFVRDQLNITYANKKAQLEEIMSLTNPTVRKQLLQSYADDMDASAIHLKAAAMPRQKTHVILPINALKDDEVYAPGYRTGEKVVLIRYPHGGKFEIPELTVNNENREGKRIIGPTATAAIGINHKVAGRLSGADFDGDTVVVIPNNKRKITTEAPLKDLEGFDPQARYGKHLFPEGFPKMSNTQTQMGQISNLITDMTIQGATHSELARAVRHSMVVIDAEKHGLNYKQSAVDNGISALRDKYQPGRYHGASTLISRISGEKSVPEFIPRPAKDGGPIDKKTGKLVFVPTNKMTSTRVVNPETGEVTWIPNSRVKTVDVARGHRVMIDDAHQLIDGNGTTVEKLYADYSNRVRGLADNARKTMVNDTHHIPVSPSAKEVYKKEVESLNAKLDRVLRNAPRERQAQRVAANIVKMKKDANPSLRNKDNKDLLKKVESNALKTARARVFPVDTETRVQITPREWEAIQAGAISHTKLEAILAKADIDQVKQLATPRTTQAVSPSNLIRARALAGAGYTQAEIADQLGLSTATLGRALRGQPS